MSGTQPQQGCGDASKRCVCGAAQACVPSHHLLVRFWTGAVPALGLWHVAGAPQKGGAEGSGDGGRRQRQLARAPVHSDAAAQGLIQCAHLGKGGGGVRSEGGWEAGTVLCFRCSI